MTKRAIFSTILVIGLALLGSILPPQNHQTRYWMPEAVLFLMVFAAMIAALVRIWQTPGYWNAKFRPQLRSPNRRHRIWVIFIVIFSVGMFLVVLAVVAVNMIFNTIAEKIDNTQSAV